MDETPRSETAHDAPPRHETPTNTTGAVSGKTRRGVPWGVFIVLLVVAFAAGFAWQFYEATTARDQLSAVERELAVERLRIRLGQAALAAQSGEFEAARRQMSEFFTQLEENSATMTDDVRHVAGDFLTMRDEVITGLSRSNPEYAGVLYGMLEQFGTAIDRSMGPTPGVGVPTDGGIPTGSGAVPAPDPGGTP